MLDLFTEPLSYGFVTRALIIGSLTGLVAGLLSCWLILVGLSLIHI